MFKVEINDVPFCLKCNKPRLYYRRLEPKIGDKCPACGLTLIAKTFAKRHHLERLSLIIIPLLLGIIGFIYIRQFGKIADDNFILQLFRINLFCPFVQISSFYKLKKGKQNGKNL